MQSPFPLLIAIFGLAVSATLAQETTTPTEPASTSAQTPEPSAEAAKKPARKTASELTPADAPKPNSSRKTSQRIPFAERTPKPEPSADERPRSFWERLFGIRRHKESPPAPTTPVATPAPKATPRVIKKVKPSGTPSPTAETAPGATPAPKITKPKTTEKPAPKTTSPTAQTEPTVKTEPPKTETAPVEKPAPKVVPPPVPKATPVPATPRPTPAPKKTGKGKETTLVPAMPTPTRKAPVAPASDADSDAQEKYRYEVAKNKALEDSEVRKLKEKADGASNDDEAKKAQRAYNKALFNKMRAVDGSIKERADRIEAAIMKRLETPE